MSPSFGSLFPDAVREDFSKRKIQPGSVFRIHVNTTTPPKIKRIVILAISSDNICVGYLFINSDINPNLFQTPSLQNLHLYLQADCREFLDHDSYLDCSEIKDLSLDELKNIISNNPSRHIGELNETDLKTATSIVKLAPTISKRQKEKYGLL
jgi:hypothetical protein